jgi:hypothetical protein
MVDKLIKAGAIFVGAGVGSLAVWSLMTLMPNTTIIAGGIAGGYITYLKVWK